MNFHGARRAHTGRGLDIVYIQKLYGLGSVMGKEAMERGGGKLHLEGSFYAP